MLNKQELRLSLLPIFTKIAAKFGVPWHTLGRKFQREAIIGQIEIMFNKEFPVIEQASKTLDIIFLAYLGCFQGNNIIQITLAKLLKERGHRIRFLLCDIELPICETTDITTHSNRKAICEYQEKHLRSLFGRTDFEIIWLTDILPIAEIEALKEQLNSDRWDTYVESKLLRYFKVGVLDRTHPLFHEFFERARHAALISAKMGEAVAQLKPDRVMFSHGTYTTRGPAKDVLNESGIPILSISRAKMAESQKFNWKTAGDWWSVDKTWEEVSGIPLNKKQEELIDDYLLSRRNHTRDIIIYNKTGEKEREATIKQLNLDPEKSVVTLFTNVLWDAASAQREIAFSNSVEWTLETISWFANNPDKQLIVRIHPAENIIGTNQPMIQLIREHFTDEIPENVILLDSGAPVNSWSLLKITDIGLVHTSTVGMELSLEGIPCVCVSKTHYRDKGFTIDVKSKEEYFDILSSGISSFDKELTQTKAKRYAYLLFLRYQLPMPFYNPVSHISIHSFKETNWEKITNDPVIPFIIKGIEEQTEFVLPDEVVYKIYG